MGDKIALPDPTLYKGYGFLQKYKNLLESHFKNDNIVTGYALTFSK